MPQQLYPGAFVQAISPCVRKQSLHNFPKPTLNGPFRLSIPENNPLRVELGAANTLDQFKEIMKRIQEMYEKFHLGKEVWKDCTEEGTQNLILPPWLCQPYVRDTPENHVKKMEEQKKEAEKKLVSNEWSQKAKAKD